MLSCVVESGSTSMNPIPLHEAIREAFSGVGLTQAQLAQRMGVDQTTVSRLANGRWGEQGGPAPDVLARIEDAAGRPRGWILVRAGYIADVATVPEAIAMDSRLTADARRMVLRVYESAVSEDGADTTNKHRQ